MNEELLSEKQKRYHIEELIHIIKATSVKEIDKAKLVPTYENGALFKYADLHSKIVNLYLVLPLERFGKDGVFFQKNGEHKPLTLRSLSPISKKLPPLSTKASNIKITYFPRKMEKTLSSRTVINTKFELSRITTPTKASQNKQVVFKRRMKIQMSLKNNKNKENNLNILKRNFINFNRVNSTSFRFYNNSNNNNHFSTKNLNPFFGNNFHLKRSSSLNVNSLFIHRERNGSLLRTFVLNNII